CSSVRRVSSSSASNRAMASVTSLPICGRSAGGTAPMPLRSPESEPLLPRYFTRAASTCCSSAACDSSARAWVSNVSICSCISDLENDEAASVVPARLRFDAARTNLRRGALGDGGKRLRVGDGDVREHLAVQRDARLLEPVDQPRV